jgi:hypothetical protein
MNKSNFIKAVKELKLRSEDYVVIGSGIMVALEIREADDVDIVVSQSVFERILANKDWSRKILDDGSTVLIKDYYEISLDRETQNAHPSLKELKNDQALVDGVPFISLNRVMELKSKRGLKKDIKDISLIKDYAKGINNN